ncbi:MAG: phenylalanine--tRNA ligase subunit beta [Thioalkalivibrionaceae bacterium]
MRVSLEALRRFVDIDETPEQLGAMLTMAGLELDALESVAPPFDKVVVARIISVEPHPDAERLRVCQVAIDAGSGCDQALTIVCGAPNAAAGLRVPCALIGAELPGGVQIAKSKIRGVESAGMLCSARELGLGDDHEGLLVLPEDAPLGASLREYMGLDDKVLELGLTPNRADCLSILGVAREVAALTGRALRYPAATDVLTETAESVEVERVADEACPFYCARRVSEIDAQARSPLWLRERLRRAGLRSVSVPVDVTNYVLLEMGQPLHAFDADRIHGTLSVRFARAGEQLVLLDGREIKLVPQDLVIADNQGPVALAGIMGGAHSAVSESTTSVVLESAHFRPQAIVGRARAHGLHTDASHRFERGVDPTLPLPAIEFATDLLIKLAGGAAGPIVISGTAANPHRQEAIVLRAGRVDAVLGTEGLDDSVADCLTRLGCEVKEGLDGFDHDGETIRGWRVRAPAHRFDIALEEDLIEEVARLHGYDRLPIRLVNEVAPIVDRRTIAERELRNRLVAQGCSEVVTFSFQAPEAVARLHPDIVNESLSNPISLDLSSMRPSHWPGLIEVARLNASRGRHDLAIFEIGQCFEGRGDDLVIVERVGGLVRGRVDPLHFEEQRPVRQFDFIELKGRIEPLLDALGAVCFVADKHPALHPGQTARIVRSSDDWTLGWIGALHPAHAQTLDLEGVLLWSLDLEPLLSVDPAKVRPSSLFPSVSRDLAVVVDEAVAVGEMLDAVRDAGVPYLESVELFDVFRGDALGGGRKSVAFRLIFRDFTRTLTVEDAVEAALSVENILVSRFAAVRRS